MILFQEEFGQKPVISSGSLGSRQRVNPVLGSHARYRLIHKVRVQIHQLRIRASRIQHPREVQSLVILPTSDAAA